MTSTQVGAARLGYRPELDGLRAFAVAAVFACHALPGVMPAGWIGVDLFFVLSGFLITTLLSEEHSRTGRLDLAGFWVRRARRLMPASLVLIAVWAWWVDGLGWVLGYSANWARASDIGLGPLGHLWSLALEEQFYVAWPLLLAWMLARKIDPVRVVVALVVLVGLWRALLFSQGAGPARIYFATDTRVDALLVGCLLAFLLPRIPWRTLVGPLAAAGMVALAVLGSPVGPGLEWHYTPAAIGSVALVLWAVHDRPRALRSGWLVWVGVRSYGIYLWHWPVLWAMQAHGLHGAGWAPLAAVLTVLAAAASYRWVEVPVRSADPLRRHRGVREVHGDVQVAA